MSAIPVLDIAPLFEYGADRTPIAAALDAACRAPGFFYVTGHGVPPELTARLQTAARRFFALPAEAKARVAMARGGRAWRGWFPVGDELTSGAADLKEGVYFGAELGPGDPRVRAGVPLHGPNLFPDGDVPELRGAVLAWMAALTRVGHALMEGLARGLALAPDFFRAGPMRDPTILFRLFHYPPARGAAWGVGEHTDYGVLTLLVQDAPGLELNSGGRWLAAPPLDGTLVCNVGDMLERVTAGRYVSTPHRVRNTSGGDRFAHPFFFDPGWDARVEPLPLAPPPPDGRVPRWDGADVHAFDGTYGDYLVGKVAKVFPGLGRAVL